MIGHIPEIHAVGLPTSKAFGEAAEAAFLAKATSLGFGVAKTWGESERYDFMVDSGHKLWRIQVKSCRCFRSYYKVITRVARQLILPKKSISSSSISCRKISGT
jgi:hypothetical protein